MATERRIPNYRKMYPQASEEVITVLRQSERKLLYQEYDLKVERFVLDKEKKKVFFIPSREDSLERLIEAEVHFEDERANVEEMVITAIMIQKLKESLSLLTTDEYELILALFFENKSEREYAEYKGVYHNSIHKKKLRILKKLKMFLGK